MAMSHGCQHPPGQRSRTLLLLWLELLIVLGLWAWLPGRKFELRLLRLLGAGRPVQRSGTSNERLLIGVVNG